MRAAALVAADCGPHHGLGGGQHGPEFQPVLEVEVEAFSRANGHRRFPDLVDAVEGQPELVSGAERPGVLPHDILQLLLQRIGREAAIVGVAHGAPETIHRVGRRRVAPPAGSIGRGGDGFPAGAFAEHQRLGDGVAGQAVGAVGAPYGLAGGVEPGDTGRHAVVHPDAAHVIVRRGRHFHRRLGEVDAVVRQAVDDRPEGGPEGLVGHVPEIQVDAPVRRPAAGFDLLQDGVGGLVAHGAVGAAVLAAVPVHELVEVSVQQTAPQLVPERVPHDRVHAHQARGQMGDGKELDELHVDELGPGPQRQGVGFPAHVGGCAVPAVDLGQAARGQDDRLGGEGDHIAGYHVHSHRPHGMAVVHHDLGHRDVAYAAHRAQRAYLAPQRARHSRTRVQEVHVTAASPAMSGRLDLANTIVLSARPVGPPAVHLEDSRRAVLAQEPGQPLVAQLAARGQRVLEVIGPVVGLFVADGGGNGHLRHDGGAAAAHQGLVQQQHGRLFPGRGNGRVHARAAGSHHQNICEQMSHAESLVQRANTVQHGAERGRCHRLRFP